MGKEIIEEKEFDFQGVNYVARVYTPEGTNYKYAEIVFADNKERPKNMKYIAREYLKAKGIEIKTRSGRVITPKAVKQLVKFLKEKK